MRRTQDNKNAFGSWWRTTLKLLNDYFALVIVKYTTDPVKQDEIWDEFCAYFRRLEMSGPVYQRFRDGSDMDRADILDTFLSERSQ